MDIERNFLARFHYGTKKIFGFHVIIEKYDTASSRTQAEQSASSRLLVHYGQLIYIRILS